MPRGVARMAVAVLLALTGTVSAATELVISAPSLESGGTVLQQGRTRRFTPASATFSLQAIAFDPLGPPAVVTQGLSVTVQDDHDPGTSYTLEFVPPTPQYTVGSYEGVLSFELFAEHPGMAVRGYDFFCPLVTAHYTVLDVAYDGQGGIALLSVDFDAECTGTGQTVTGSLRLAAGDATCAGAADGTACDDLDACTATSTCQSGRCEGSDAVVCTGAGDTCHDPAVCSPAAGTCLPVTAVADGTTCDDGNACTDVDLCRDGVCEANFDTSCNDGDACTFDRCVPATGCVFPPAPGRCGVPGSPSTFLFVQSPAGEPISRGHNRMLLPGEQDVSVYVDGNRVTVAFFDQDASPTDPYSWTITLGAPDGVALVPGAYENSRPFVGQDTDRPLLGVSASPFGADCPDATGRFVVDDVATHTRGFSLATLDALVATVELRCHPDAPVLTLRLRYRAGDAACLGAADGTLCDDANACTVGDTCRQGTCVGTTATTCGETPSCHDAPLCDPGTGACVAASLVDDDTTCSDADACVPEGTCRAGACTSEPGACEDFDVCSTDACDGAGGCTHHAIDGSCWAMRGTTTFYATALGHTCQCTTRTTVQPLAIYADGTFAIPGGPLSCRGQTVIVPPESGTWSRKGRRYHLSTENLDELLGIARDCTGTNVPIARYRTSVQISRSGQRLTGFHLERAHSGPVVLTAVTRFRGRPTDRGVTQPARTGAARCGPELAACLQAQIRGG